MAGLKENAIRIAKVTDKLAWMIIQSSPTGEDSNEWMPIMPEDLPEWVKDPVVMGRMWHGEKVCMNPDRGTVWYRGVRVNKPRQH